MKFKTRFETPKRVVLKCPDTPEDKRTKQEFLKDTDINNIVKQYKKTGRLPESARSAAARYGDFSGVPSFAEMQAKIIAGSEVFAALPAAVRKQYDNDPGQFLAAAATPEGLELMKKLGLGAEAGVDASDSPRKPSSGSAGVQPAKAGTEPALEAVKASDSSSLKDKNK